MLAWHGWDLWHAAVSHCFIQRMTYSSLMIFIFRRKSDTPSNRNGNVLALVLMLELFCLDITESNGELSFFTYQICGHFSVICVWWGVIRAHIRQGNREQSVPTYNTRGLAAICVGDSRILLSCFIITLLWFFSTGANTAVLREKLSAEFCKTPMSDIYEEEITLTNLNKANHGYIRMPGSDVNQSIDSVCQVKFSSGSQNGIILFHASSGPCMKDGIINNTSSDERPCSEQGVFLSGVTRIALVVGKPTQAGFIIHFTGMEQWTKYS